MHPRISEVKELLVSNGHSVTVDEVLPLGDFLRIPSEEAKAAIRTLKTKGDMNYYVDIFGVDTGEDIDAVVHLRNLQTLTDLIVKVTLPYGGTWNSIWEDYPAALMPEREMCEMFGLKLAGHPNPKRLLTTDMLPPMLLKSQQLRTAQEVRRR